jgi:general secretion pathway protein G
VKKEVFMREKGFTLVEMLLVLAIIGILVTILLPSVFGVTTDAKKKQVKGDLRLIQAALGEYYIRYNTFPDPGGDYVQNLLDMRPRILKDRPVDPFSDPPVTYMYDFLDTSAPNDIPTYVVYSVGVSKNEQATINSSDDVDYTAECIFVTNAATLTQSN